MTKTNSSSAEWVRLAPYALLSLIAFLLAVGILFLLVFKAELLTQFGLTGNVYYVLLVVLGLCVAVFLFGVLKSFGEYKGKHFGGQLVLGGPIVGWALVVVLGFLLPKPAQPFSLTVFVHGPSGLQDTVLRNTGIVILDVGSDRRRENIGDKGEATFQQIPFSFRGRSVPVSVESAFSAVPKTITLTDDPVYLEVRHKEGTISGRVQEDTSAALPVSGASLQLGEGLQTTSDINGQFEITIPGERWRAEFNLSVTAAGYGPASQTVYPDSNPITIVLRKEAR